MKLHLYHQIGEGGEESAAVRAFLVSNGLSDLIEFSNVFYAEAQQRLFERIGRVEAPVLVIDDSKVLRGRAAIVDWLKTNLLCLRD